MLQKRRRATAIIALPQGILLTGMRFLAYNLPGGGINQGELPEHAIIREILEETGLSVKTASFLFEHISYAQHHFVFSVVAVGLPAPSNEVQTLAFYPPSTPIKLSSDTTAILKRYGSHS